MFENTILSLLTESGAQTSQKEEDLIKHTEAVTN
jgi:hypothetical protein